MPQIGALNTFVAGTTISAVPVNDNFEDIRGVVNTYGVLTDVAKTITAQHSFSPTAPQAPFVLGANAQGQLVTGLNAAQLGGKTEATLAIAASQITAGAFGAGAYTFPSTLGVTGAVTLASTLAVTGLGTFSSGVKLAGGALQVSGYSAPASGQGLELGWTGTAALVRGYDRSGAAYLPLYMDGSTITIVSGTTGLGLVVASNGTARATAGARVEGSSSISGSGAGLELAYDSFSTTGYAATFDRAAAQYRNIALLGTTVQIQSGPAAGPLSVVAQWAATGDMLQTGGGLQIRSTNQGGFGGSGGLEMGFSAGNAYIASFNRSGGVYQSMQFDATSFRFDISGVQKATITSAGITATSFFKS